MAAPAHEVAQAARARVKREELRLALANQHTLAFGARQQRGRLLHQVLHAHLQLLEPAAARGDEEAAVQPRYEALHPPERAVIAILPQPSARAASAPGLLRRGARRRRVASRRRHERLPGVKAPPAVSA